MLPESGGGQALAFPESFYCEHSTAKSRVMALVRLPGAVSTLHAVLSCADPLLAHRVADLLWQAARTGVGTFVHDEAEHVAALLPDAPRASFVTAMGWAAAGRWPVAETKTVTTHEIIDSYSFAPSDVLPPTPEGRDLAERPTDGALIVQIESVSRIRVHDSNRMLAAAVAAGWSPDPDTELDQRDPDDLLGAVMFLFDSTLVPGADVIESDGEGSYIEGNTSRTGVLVDDIGFGRLFPVDKQQIAADDEDPDGTGWRLTPKTAHALHTALCVLADEAFDDAIERGDIEVDPKDGAWEVFDRLPRLTWRADQQWRRLFARAADDLASDLKAGRWPEPRCFAEEMCLHLAVDDAEAFEEQTAQTQGLPEHELDYDWDGCREYFFEDFDILNLSDPSQDGIEDPDDEDNQRFGMGDMRPANWFAAFGGEEPRDPARGFRR